MEIENYIKLMISRVLCHLEHQHSASGLFKQGLDKGNLMKLLHSHLWL